MNLVYFLKFLEYATWYDRQTAKIRAQIDSRLKKIQDVGHYEHVRKLSPVLFEINSTMAIGFIAPKK